MSNSNTINLTNMDYVNALNIDDRDLITWLQDTLCETNAMGTETYNNTWLRLDGYLEDYTHKLLRPRKYASQQELSTCFPLFTKKYFICCL